MASKYSTAELVGVMLKQDLNGQYHVENTALQLADFHSWRVGKHTKGKLRGPGQIFLTEQNMAVALVEVKSLSFKNRHDFTVMGRFTNETLPDEQFNAALQKYLSLEA
ncbi:hypothetical protein PAF15_00350 [Weissella koreensis]|uniref:DUF7671 domain-containing protein n=1 Tax=Weissella koreensis TaxID=165096 RepID=A0A7H1MK63_9LACO|nr:hypothetical protein [Weissella koreensis]AEJ22989.1 hypothetical protein WKK_00565 [Weissella koreensis KACC 15510]AVH74591.1 hypothetical protein C4597_00535 [Weissella koreensis]EJF33941.1 hypothetical protein JC2156_02490 [Weissella koreensis KCTC 3621]EJF34231.1 hypothetical protein JC2156_01130 [Weissella koreensis KCTC 3621]MCZ9310428.1 hypothetical protein [Weissella koreensis]